MNQPNRTGFCAERGCDAPRTQGSPYCLPHKKWNDLLTNALVYMEYGYKQCEAGHNLEMARDNMLKSMRGGGVE